MEYSFPTLVVSGDWEELLHPADRGALEQVLPAYIAPRRWFGGKARQVSTARIIEAIPIATDAGTAFLTVVRLTYTEGSSETYALPLAFASGADEGSIQRATPHAIIARIRNSARPGVLYDAISGRAFCAALLAIIAEQHRLPGERGELRASTTSAFQRLRGAGGTPLEPKVVTAEQSNSSIIYGDRMIMKLFRRMEAGLNPDLEIARFLTERTSFANIPPAAGALEYHAADGDSSSLAILQGFVPNQGDAWHYTLTTLAHAFSGVWAKQPARPPRSAAVPAARPLDLVAHEPPVDAQTFIHNYVDSARLLGRRTAELHLALASDATDPNFAPEPFAIADQRAIYDSMRERAVQSLQTLRRALGAGTVPESVRAGAEQVLMLESLILDQYQALLARRFMAMRTRVHGDYHLGQVLYTGADFFIIDFEGEPARTLSERRRKGSAIQDVAGMLRSFHYAPYAVLFGQAPGFAYSGEQIAALQPWAGLWHRWVSVAFLEAYLATAGEAPFLPGTRDECATLLDAFLLDKAVYELNYELNNRPAWVQIPVEGILQLIRPSP